MLLVIAHIQLHKQIAKAIYNWNANEGCGAMWLLLHCETHQVASAAGMVDGHLQIHTHIHTTCISIREKKPSTYHILKIYLLVISVYLWTS